MNHAEALALLEASLNRRRSLPYEELVRRVDAGPECQEAHGASGANYQLEFTAMWDGPPLGNVRVMGAVDDGGLRAFAPLTLSFIKAADGGFVGE
jgi:hypothetical protein